MKSVFKTVFTKSRIAALLPTLLLAALPLSTPLCAPAARADESQQNQNDGRSGITEGVLTGKGNGFIMVLADGQRESTRVLPRWIGGTPKQGGGLDKQMLLIFQQLVVGSRLRIAWIRDEQVRAVKIEVLPTPAPDNGDGNDNGGQDN